MIATDINQIILATEWHGITRTTSVSIRETPMQKRPTNIVIATEWHGIARTTIREYPWNSDAKNSKQILL